MGIDKSLNINTSRPGNTLGMGNPQLPQGVSQGDIGNTGSDFHNQKVGSGDFL